MTLALSSSSSPFFAPPSTKSRIVCYPRSTSHTRSPASIAITASTSPPPPLPPLKIVRFPALDRRAAKHSRLRFARKLKNLLLSKPKHFLPLRVLSRCRAYLNPLFNKREEDFPSLKHYNDYLEEVEDMTFNLIGGTDVEEIEAYITKYQEENAEQIIISRAHKAEELAAALTTSKGPAQTETTDYGAGLSAQTTTVVGAGMQGQYAPTGLPGTGLMQPRPTGGMVPQPVPIGGPGDRLHGYATEEDEEVMKARAARAGGWTADLSRKRALEEAFSSIWV